MRHKNATLLQQLFCLLGLSYLYLLHSESIRPLKILVPTVVVFSLIVKMFDIKRIYDLLTAHVCRFFI